MKRNINLFVLAFEIAAIVVLHAIKMNQPHSGDHELNNTVTKVKAAPSVAKQYTLLSIK